MSVRLSARISAALNGRISENLVLGKLYDNMSRNSKFGYKWTKLVSCSMDNYVRFMVAGNASSLLPQRCTTTPSICLLLPVT